MTKSRSSKGHRRSKNQSHQHSDETLDAKVRKQATDAVLANTTSTYEKKIWTMKQWLKERGKPQTPISDTELSRFLADHKGGVTNGNTARNWRSAARKWRTLESVPEENSAATALLDTQIRGITYQAGEAVQHSADIIDSGRLGEMTRLLVKWNFIEYALHFVFVFYSVFRKVRGGNITVGDVRFNTDVGTTIASKRAKFANSLKCEPGSIGNFKEIDNLTKFLRGLTKGKKADDRLFPNYVEKTANDLIKRCATALKWGSGKWCVLSLRHGSSREATSVLEDEPTVEDVVQQRQQGKLSKRFGHSHTKSKRTYQDSAGSTGKRRRLHLSRVLTGLM